jgi:hypothetical protein
MESVMHETNEKRPSRQYRDLPARPIMVYPQSPEEREMIEEAAKAEGRKLSPFIVWVVKKYIREQQMMSAALGRFEAAKRQLEALREHAQAEEIEAQIRR